MNQAVIRMACVGILGFITCLVMDGYCATYYVSTTGNDTNPGTIGSPWRTIQYAAETMVSGDTVYIRGGVYNENIETQMDGVSTDYIVFSAYAGETPMVDGTGVADANQGFRVFHSYIKLIGLEVRNWPETGIWIMGAGFTEISDCTVHDVPYAITASEGAHDFTLNRVEMYRFEGYGFDASPAGGPDCYNGTFHDCVAHSALDPNMNVDGFALGHGTQSNFVFNRCETYGVFDGFDISARDTTLNRCTAHNCTNGGYKLWQDNVNLINCLSYNNESSNVELDWDGNPGRTTTLMNCTFMDAGTFNIWVENSGSILHMHNCIIAGGDNIGLAFEQLDASNYTGDYNIFQNDNTERYIAVGYTDEFSNTGLNAWRTYSGEDGHSIFVDSVSSIFVNAATYDLHLPATSAAIDAGTGLGAPTEDYDGNPRPQGGGYDIGAYEYTVTTTKTYELCNGLNLLFLGLNNAAIKNASTLLSDICPGNADAIWWYNCALKTFQPWTSLDVGSGWPVSVGLPFWVNITSLTGCTWQQQGSMPASISFSLCTGLNMIGIPFNVTSITKASDLLTSVPNCTGVYRWKREESCANAQGFDAYFDISDPSEDFILLPGRTYWVSVTTPGTWTP